MEVVDDLFSAERSVAITAEHRHHAEVPVVRIGNREERRTSPPPSRGEMPSSSKASQPKVGPKEHHDRDTQDRPECRGRSIVTVSRSRHDRHSTSAVVATESILEPILGFVDLALHAIDAGWLVLSE